MKPWVKNMSLSLGLPLVLVLNLAFVEKGQEIQLQGNFNARATRNFTRQAGNIKFVMPTGTRLRVEQARKLNSGHYGLLVEVLSGSNQAQKVWVYYNTQNPRIQINAPAPAPAVKGETLRPVPGLDRPPAADAGNLDALFDNLTKPPRSPTPVVTPDTTATLIPVKQPEVGSTNGLPPNLNSPATASVETSCTANCGTSQPTVNITESIRAITKAARMNAAVGARQTMATMYQSCSVLTKEPYNPFTDGDLGTYIDKARNGSYFERFISRSNFTRLVQSHYYLKDIDYSNHRPPLCRDMRKAPPVFIFGARPSFSQNGREINILNPRRAGESQVTGLDCSAFVSVALSTAGLKLRPNVRSAAQNLTTSRDLLSMNGNNSCLERPTFRRGSTIQSGDVFAMKGHTYIIDRVGEDPFGISALKQAGRFPSDPQSCFGLNPPSDAFNFTIIQSAARGNKSAMIVEAKNYIRPLRTKEGEIYNRFRDVFEAACLAEFGLEVPGRNRRGSTLLRHKSHDPRCVFNENQKPILRGQECTGDCLKEALQ